MLDAYRDDGPLASWIGRLADGRLRAGEASLTLLGLLPVVAVLAWPAQRLSVGAASAGIAIGVVLVALGAHDTGRGRLAWLVPALLRTIEFGGLVKLTVVAAPDAMPACYALLGVLAFHHYDTVYRLRHQRVAPPSWVRGVGAGWDGRLLVASALALAGGLRFGLLVAAVGLALVYVSESTVSWIRFGRAKGSVRHEDEDEDGD
jgi:hypothetical protein